MTMNVLLSLNGIDEEERALAALSSVSGVQVKVARTMAEARALFAAWRPDVAFVDPSIALQNGPFAGTRASDGLQQEVSVDSLSKTGYLCLLKSVNPRINLVFVTSGPDFAMVALDLRASGYLVRPLMDEAIINELRYLRFPDSQVALDLQQASAAGAESAPAVSPAPRPAVAAVPSVSTLQTSKGLFVRAFGNFEVFYNGTPVQFKYGLTKELFAYLVDRAGAMVTNGELSAVLWADDRTDSHSSYLRMLKLDLVRTLASLGNDQVVTKTRGKIACVPSELNCDYFHFLRHAQNGDLKGIAAYRGEYMAQYSWAEATNAFLATV